ncbi:MAG TPA: PAS domain S-box protein [Methanocalculus sp.]|nr:PAS domain S-box protein [Methanocalculus sp.]
MMRRPTRSTHGEMEGTGVILHQDPLRRSEDIWQAIASFIDFLPDATFAINADGEVVAWNSALEERSGVKASDVIGKGDYIYGELIYGKRLPVLIDYALHYDNEITLRHSNIKRRGHIIEATTHGVDPGSTHTIHWARAAPLLNSRGEIIGAIESIRDITERHTTRQELTESEERYRRLAENAQDIIYRIEILPERKFSYVNPAAYHITGYTPEEHYKDPDLGYKLVHPDDRYLLEEIATGIRSIDKPLPLRWIKKDGSIVWVEQRNIPIFNDDGEIVAIEGVGRDITEKIEHDIEEREHADEILRYSHVLKNLNKKLNLMTGITRHDILNQLMVLDGYLMFALDRTQKTHNDEQLEQYLNLIETASQNIQHQIEFTRQYQNLGVQKPIWHEISSLIEELPGNGIEIRNETSGLALYADPLLPKVFSNLMENAIRYGGADLSHIRVWFERKESEDVSLFFEDDGVGIPEKEKERIFERGVGKNTGLGLFFIREILGITGIIIQEIGKEGQGAVFEMIIPSNAYRIDDR